MCKNILRGFFGPFGGPSGRQVCYPSDGYQNPESMKCCMRRFPVAGVSVCYWNMARDPRGRGTVAKEGLRGPSLLDIRDW